MSGWDFIDSDNFEGQRSNVLKYQSGYLIEVSVQLRALTVLVQRSENLREGAASPLPSDQGQGKVFLQG